jgi:uncharacterized membrane protein YvlD (DUF360 family)
MQLVGFLRLWLANFLILLLAWLLGGQTVVLGSLFWPPVIAALVTGLLLAAIVALVKPVFEVLKIKIRNENYWTLVFLVTNVVGLWVLARLAAFTGFGIVRFWVAIVLGIIITILQWIFDKYLLKKAPAKKA